MDEDFVDLGVGNSSGTLAKNQAQKQPITERTILLMGNSGAGKSTFINDLANILNFGSLQEALDAPNVKCLISTNLPLGIGLEFEIPGEDPSTMVAEAFQSETVLPRTQIFDIGNCRLRLVDTPGFLDTQGRDQKHIKQILHYINQYPQIVILIVMAPEMERSNNFEPGFEAMLGSLDKDALRNIYFVFTKAKSKNFQWKAIPSAMILSKYLNKLRTNNGINVALDEEHVFCVDNAFLRFLYGMKMAGSEQQKKEIAEMFNRAEIDDCWKRSFENVFSFLNHIFESKDLHRTAGMFGLFRAKQLVQAMIEPLANGISALEGTKAALNQLFQEYKTADVQSNLLKEQLKIPIKIVMTQAYEKPRLVCTNCNVRNERDSNGDCHTIYGQICCRDCQSFAGVWGCDSIKCFGGCI